MHARGIKITNSSNSKMPTTATNAKKSVVPKSRNSSSSKIQPAPSPAAQQLQPQKRYLPGDIRYKGQAAAESNTTPTAVVNQQMSGKKKISDKMSSDDSQMPQEESSEDAPTPPEDYFDTPEDHQKAVDMQRGREAGRNTAGGMRRDRDVSASFDDHKDFLYILDTEGMDPKIISEQTIKALHANVMSGERKSTPSEYRVVEVTVGGARVEATAAQVPGKMAEFVEWLNAEDDQTNDVATFAATAHYKMAKIHPFLDGNGRTCRLLVNFI